MPLATPINRTTRWQWRYTVILTVAAIGAIGFAGSTIHAAVPDTHAVAEDARVHESVAPAPPKKARDLLAALEQRQGVPLPGYVGGREFNNRERRLPRGAYREYDVNPRVRGRPRDAERIVIEQQSGKAYYTPDHYRTFVPLN